MNFFSVGLALLAACCNGASNVLERKANLQMRTRQALSIRLMWRLLHNGLWLLGLVTVITSFVLQAAALSAGTLAAVQPIIVLELPITLIVGSRVLCARLRPREWVAIAALTGGLVALLVGLDPRSGTSAAAAPAITWLVGVPATGGLVAGLVLLGRCHDGSARAALFGAAAGIQFGMTAALMKGMTQTLRHGIGGPLTAWQTYAMMVSGIAGMVLMQNALQAGPLVAAQPGITLLDPMTAIVWGILGFHEQVNSGWWLAVAGAGIVAMSLGAVLLSHAPAMQAHTGSGDIPGEGPRPRPPADSRADEAADSADPTSCRATTA